ncbi:MAG: hypothetical protein II865_02375 [Bacteroidales bacterium]|nr:hypothetical protein [Bacteroidales bacterium]
MESIINQITVKVDRAELLKIYDIFRIDSQVKNPSKKNPYFPNGAKMVDAPFENSNVLSVVFEGGKTFYVLLKHNENNFRQLNGELVKYDGGNNIISKDERDTGFKQVPEHVIAQLLLNSLGTYETDELKFNNITGHFYCYDASWIKRFKGEDAPVSQIPCLELKITKDLVLKWSIQTFSSAILRKEIEFKAKKFEEYPQYILSRNQTLRRKPKDSKDVGFIARQTKKDKNEITFLDIRGIEYYKQCKLGVITNVLKKFNEKCGKFVEVQFLSIPNLRELVVEPKLSEKTKALIGELIKKQPIRIVDAIGDSYSSDFVDDLQSALKERFSVQATVIKHPKKGCLNLRIIHDKDTYDGGNDPHNDKFEGCVIQHLTYENFKTNVTSAINTVAEELLIKNDIQGRSISLVDWKEYNFSDDWTFGLRIMDDKTPRFFFMTIHPDGTFDFEELELDLFNMNKFNDCMEIFDNDEDGIVCGTIQHGESINIIQETDLRTLPDMFEVESQLKRYKQEVSVAENKRSVKGVRSTQYKNQLLGSCLDIKCYQKDGCQYYYSGVSGYGLNSTIQCAANIRMVVPYKESELFFEQLLPLMSVTFVRNGQLTVVPFPFKYLREYITTMKP